MSRSGLPRVVIFSDHLLYPSETFIQAQAGALSGFEPVFAGSRRVAGLDLREKHIYTINQGGIWGTVDELRFKLLGYAPRLVNRLEALNPVLFHAHHGPNGLRALSLTSRLKIPLIVTFHGSDVTITNLRDQESHLGFRSYLRKKDKLRKSGAFFLTVSRFLRRKLLAQGFPEERILVQYTGVDTKKFKPESTERNPLILFVGRLVESKGGEFLIRAVAEIQKQMPAVDLVLIGDGRLRSDLEKRAKQSLRRYRFLGARTSDEVAQWMNRASVVCVPSVRRHSGEEEAFGMVCAEAQAVAKPVVAFDSGGISEIVSHGRTGFLATEGDWQTLAEFLLLLLQNPDLSRRFGRAGRELILEQFDLRHCTALLEQTYLRILETGSASKHRQVLQESVVNFTS